MKQIATFLIAALVALVAKADYSTLSFRTVGGATHYLEITGLQISFTQENLTASNSTTDISIPLSQLEYMEFSDNSSLEAVSILDADKTNGETAVFTLNGSSAGTFSTFSEALNSVETGIYMFKFNDGTTLKIAKK